MKIIRLGAAVIAVVLVVGLLLGQGDQPRRKHSITQPPVHPKAGSVTAGLVRLNLPSALEKHPTWCDGRIAATVLDMVRTSGLVVSDCYRIGPHESLGEHPLGLAVDLLPPGLGKDWNRHAWRPAVKLARAYGWRARCNITGCAYRLQLVHSVMRFIAFHGVGCCGSHFVPYPLGHEKNPVHVHFSWSHSPVRKWWQRPTTVSTFK